MLDYTFTSDEYRHLNLFPCLDVILYLFVMRQCHWTPLSDGEPYLAEIGIGLTGFGVFFSFLGIIFFFDKGLIAMGNVSSI
jgi:hypothetical protein